jgi:hypothetical protein
VLALNLQAASSIAEYLYRSDLTRLTPYTVDRVCRWGHMKKPEVREGATRILERLGTIRRELDDRGQTYWAVNR